MRSTEKILNIFSVVLIGVGFLIGVTFFLPASLFDPAPIGVSAGTQALGDQSRPRAVVENLAGKRITADNRKSRGAKIAGKREKKTRVIPAPKDKMLRMTIPAMSRIKDDTIPTARGTDKDQLHDHAAIHLEETGFPWEPNANVYMAGHRIGYPATDSFLAFYDLNKLAVGDKVFLTDAKDRRYTYRVFRVLVVEPTNLTVTQPVRGRNILTLQTCTLPNYTQRLIVRAEKVSTEKVS